MDIEHPKDPWGNIESYVMKMHRQWREAEDRASMWRMIAFIYESEKHFEQPKGET